MDNQILLCVALFVLLFLCICVTVISHINLHNCKGCCKCCECKKTRHNEYENEYEYSINYA